MDYLLYIFARVLIACLQSLPLPLVARLGRFGGGVAYLLDSRHRRVALANLTMCFDAEKSPAEIRDLARENFRRIGENYACAIKTAAMTASELQPFVEFTVPPEFQNLPVDPKPESVVVGFGHFGNFELYARFGSFIPQYQCVTTYRGLRQPVLNDLLQSLREKSGCKFYERRFEAVQLKAAMNQPGTFLGLLADQHAGQNGLRLPFLGHPCSTSAAPALFALRYDCPLYTGFCYRVAPARWRLVAGEKIPTSENGRARSTAEIMLDVNQAFETAVRQDPANWFWVHKRWKQTKQKPVRRISPASEHPPEPASSASTSSANCLE
jgi:KDO2-lipid IV(A) lauroyltransferase